MKGYHKINSLFKRDRKTNKLLIGDFAKPEFELLQFVDWEFEEKLDGTNMRIHLEISEAQEISMRVGGRTDKAQIPVGLLEKIYSLIDFGKVLEVFHRSGSVTLYGEGVGSKIQKGSLGYVKDATADGGFDFILFDILVNGYNWLEREAVYGIGGRLGLNCSKIIGTGPISQAVALCTSGFESQLRDTRPEGVVLRPKLELRDRKGARIISKAVLRDYFEG